MKKILVVIDMQNDFVSGSLGSEKAKSIVPIVAQKIKDARERGERIFATKDTHLEDTYFNTQEGKNLPVLHCVKYTPGWELVDGIKELVYEGEVWQKPTFGSMRAMTAVAKIAEEQNAEVEFCGLCTDICVIANIALLKTLSPETKISIDSRACAGVTKEKHDAALEVCRSIQVEVR